jgi:hypothetical protein
MASIESIPDEFRKIIKDFITDMVTTFPEYEQVVSKWWSYDFDRLDEEEQSTKYEYIFNYCIRVYPERLLDILYKSEDLMSQDSTVNTEFLPGISFKYVWQCDISAKTKETIWKYLQLILLSLVGSIKDKDAFGDTAKLFNTINETEFKERLQETLENMQKMFETTDTASLGGGREQSEPDEKTNSQHPFDIPSADDIHGHIKGMLGGKLGQLAHEIAEETAGQLDIDMEKVTDANSVFQMLFQNPGKLMGLVKNVGEKLDQRIKSGDLNQSELFSEATEMMGKMKEMPGMDGIQQLLQKMGMGPTGADTKGPSERAQKAAKMKENLRKRAEMKHAHQMAEQLMSEMRSQTEVAPKMNDEQLIALFDNENNSKDKMGKKKQKSKAK